jgi:hypothetical protein
MSTHFSENTPTWTMIPLRSPDERPVAVNLGGRVFEFDTSHHYVFS